MDDPACASSAVGACRESLYLLFAGSQWHDDVDSMGDHSRAGSALFANRFACCLRRVNGMKMLSPWTIIPAPVQQLGPPFTNRFACCLLKVNAMTMLNPWTIMPAPVQQAEAHVLRRSSGPADSM